MSSMHRTRWIDAQIRLRNYPNCGGIAERFSISLRQAARDVEYLRDSMGAPIEYCRKRKGYYYAGEAYALTHVLMSDQQRLGLAYLAEQYGKLETEHARHMARLFRRLIDNDASNETELSLPLFPIDPAELNRFDTLTAAIRNYKKVDISFYADNGLLSSIRLSPYRLYTFQEENFVVGYCEPGKQIRFFSLKGLHSAALTDARYDLSPLLKQADIVPEVMNEPNVAYIDLEVAAYAETLGNPCRAAGNGLFRIEYYDPNKLIAALFACPAGLRIVSPAWLRNKYIHQLQKHLKHALHHDTICHEPVVIMNDKQVNAPDYVYSE